MPKQIKPNAKIKIADRDAVTTTIYVDNRSIIDANNPVIKFRV